MILLFMVASISAINIQSSKIQPTVNTEQMFRLVNPLKPVNVTSTKLTTSTKTVTLTLTKFTVTTIHKTITITKTVPGTTFTITSTVRPTITKTRY